jgi:mRNA-degrading endonuclease RelE of RelBE toxin-antitoxin system
LTSRATPRFWKALSRLPENIKERARKAFRLLQTDPLDPSLVFKRIHGSTKIYSARVDHGYRAVGRRKGSVVTWVWIGSHAEYDRMTKQLRR